MTPAPPQASPSPIIDPDYVNMGFAFLEDQHLGDSASCLIMKTKDAKKLGLMVGDIITIKLSKD